MWDAVVGHHLGAGQAGADGDELDTDAEVLSVSGRLGGILTAERTALNFLQRLSGIATHVLRKPRPMRIRLLRKPVNLFKFFWSEIRMIGARLYEPEDFEAAIELLGKQRLPIDSLITQVNPIEEAQQVFETIDANPAGMKYVIQCGEST